jgi:hypothetical protein
LRICKKKDDAPGRLGVSPLRTVLYLEDFSSYTYNIGKGLRNIKEKLSLIPEYNRVNQPVGAPRARRGRAETLVESAYGASQHLNY